MTSLIKFQFHFGSIGRAWIVNLVKFLNLFQFHFGSIGRLEQIVLIITSISFNSTLVRLEAISYFKVFVI